jgi:hypothetical protein
VNTNPRLLPVDDAASKPDFLSYRVRLQMAVERRDVGAVIEAADPGIRLGFDGSGGAATLRTLFSDRPELWDELRVVLARGGRFSSPSSFAAPYVYANWPGQFDAFECAAITGTNVRLRSAPKLDAPIVATVSHYQSMRLDVSRRCLLWSRVPACREWAARDNRLVTPTVRRRSVGCGRSVVVACCEQGVWGWRGRSGRAAGR